MEENKKVDKPVVIFLIVMITLIISMIILLIVQWKNSTGFFGLQNKPLGTEEIKKIVPVKVKKNMIVSKQLGYKCTLPNSFTVSDSNKWQGENSCLQFSAYNKEGIVLLVSIYLRDGSFYDEDPSKFSSERMAEESFQKSYKDFDPSKIEFVDFMGFSCAHYAGVYNPMYEGDREKYVEEYKYYASYCIVTFYVQGDEGQKNKIEEIFDCFQKL